MKKVLKRVVAFMLMLAMCVCATGADASAEASVTTSGVQSSWDGMTTENKYVGENFSVTFSLASYWEGGYNANIKVENTGSSVIENWYLSFALNNKLTTVWNAEVVSNENGQYVVKNANWNADIPVGGCVEFGISVNENFSGFPKVYNMLGDSFQLEEEAYTIEYCLDSDWGEGFTGRILITNNSDQTVEDWMLEFEFDREITEIWNGVISEQDGAYYAITNAVYNANINPGETISFGFKGTNGDATDEPFDFELSQVKYVQKSDNLDGILAELEEYRKRAEESINNWEIPDLPVVQGEFRDILKNAEKFYYSGRECESSEQYEEAISAYQDTWMYLEENRYKLDEINTLISELHSKPDADYDGDLLLNGFEMDAFCGYLDPFNNDTDGDGLSDGEDDYDLDGLSNYEEQRYGTSPISADTDEGGINDKREIELGLDPTNPNDDNTSLEQNIISDETGVSIKILAEGDAEGKVYVDIAETCIDSEYAISPFYEINTDVKFSTAQITIPVDLSGIPADDYDKLYIVYYDEDLGGFIPLENSTVDVSNSSVSATTNHFSLYAVFYVKNWGTYFNVPLNQPKRTTEDQFNLVDIMFVIDSSGSMSWNDSNDYRKTAAKAFVDALLPGTQVGVVVGDRAGVVDFDSYAVLKQPLTDDFEAVKKAIDGIDDNGGTNIGAGVKIANDELISNSEEDRLKIEILLTDGSGSYSSSYTTEAINNGIVIYTIGLGSDVNSSLLSQIATATGGQYFHVNNASELPLVYDRIKDVTIAPQDTDKDGIPDSLETEGMRVGLFNSKLVYTEPEDDDSDDDGLLDGEEIDVNNVSEITVFGHTIKWYKMICDPHDKDSDGDKLTDYEELKEYNSNPKKRHSDSDKLDDFTECIDFHTDPNLEDTDGDGFDDYFECTNTGYNPVIFDTVVKSDGQYIVAKNQSWDGRLHIQSPIVVNEGISLALKNIDKIIIEDLASRMRYESSIFRIYGELIASDDSYKQLEYDGDDLWTGVFVDENGKADLNKFTISGMEYALYIYGGHLDITNSTIKSCYQGIEATDGAVVNVSETNFRAIDDADIIGDLAVRIIGGKEYFHDGGKIDKYSTGIVLFCNGNESKIQNVEIKNGDTGIYIDASKANISNVTFDKNSIGVDAIGNSTNVYLENSNVWNSEFYGIRMSKQAVVYTYNNAFYGNGVDIKNEFLKETLLSLATSLIPYIGDGTDLFSSIYGRDIFTDESLSAFERGLGFLCLGELRRVDDVIDATKIAKKLPNGVKHLDVAASLTTRYSDELVTLLNKCDSKTVDLVLEMSQKHGDSFVEIFLKYSDEGVELLASKHGREAIDVIAKLGEDGIKALKFNDNLLSKYSKLDDIEKFAAETASLAKELKFKGFTTSNYLKVMKKSFGWETSKKLGDILQAHHIFPEKFFGEGAEYANLLKDVGISYCDPRLLVWYDKSTHLSNVLKYNDDIYEVIVKYKDNLPELIKGIREVARRYGFEPKF